jgi:hypothetical protein
LSVVPRALLVACAAVALAAPSAALAHQGNPNYLSQVRGLSPSLNGLSVEVLNRDDRLLLHNTSGHTVIVDGYSDEPYARVRGDGTVEVNTNSEAYYLNRDRFADAPIPKGVDSDKPPVWQPLSKTGRFEWHDHRMHYMGKGRPKQVKDPAVRQTVFDWKVPLEVDGRPGAIRGRLLWTPPPDENLPLGAIFAFAGIVIALCVVVIVVRRRRASGEREPAEAW